MGHFLIALAGSVGMGPHNVLGYRGVTHTAPGAEVLGRLILWPYRGPGKHLAFPPVQWDALHLMAGKDCKSEEPWRQMVGGGATQHDKIQNAC